MLGFLESPKKVQTDISKLNDVVDQREKMIDSIIYSKHTVKTDKQYNSLYKKYSVKSFSALLKLSSL
jgi:hypothetical protein